MKGLVAVALVVGSLASVFALVRRWRLTTLSLIAVAAIAGFVLLGWAMSQGIWAEPGRLHSATPAAREAFNVGFPLASFGTAVFLIGLLRPDPTWGDGSKALVVELAVRVVATFVASSVIGAILFTIATGYAK